MPKTVPAGPKAEPKMAPAAAAKAPPGAWWELAVCHTADPELFFPVSGSGAAAQIDMARAKVICQSCTVRDECLNYALDTRQAHGVWGGRSEEERRAIIATRHRELRQRS
jgi:WhiB family transcriptional regulator, redox-sensing transcriptional regulator